MIRYQRLMVLFYGPKSQDFISLPGHREGLRIVNATFSGDYVCLDVLTPHPEGGKRFYPEKGEPTYGYPDETRVYVEVVELGQGLCQLDACDFVGLGEHDAKQKAIFASVRK